MGRQKKIKSLQQEVKNNEGNMTEEAVLESLQTEIDLARQELEKTKLEIEEKRKELEAQSNRQISTKEVEIMEHQEKRNEDRVSSDALIARQRAYDSEKITGRFMNIRNPGQPIKLPYHKYVDDPVKWWNFEHNKVYTIPRGFVDQINEHYHTPRFVQKTGPMDPDQPSSQVAEVDTSQKKYAFVPIHF